MRTLILLAVVLGACAPKEAATPDSVVAGTRPAESTATSPVLPAVTGTWTAPSVPLPRTSAGASGLGSQMSMWLGPPSIIRKMQFFAFDSMRLFYVNIDLPAGVTIDRTLAEAERMAKIVSSDLALTV